MEERGAERRPPGPAPKSDEIKGEDRTEGSLDPGISEYGPEHPEAPVEKDAGPDEAAE